MGTSYYYYCLLFVFLSLFPFSFHFQSSGRTNSIIFLVVTCSRLCLFMFEVGFDPFIVFALYIEPFVYSCSGIHLSTW